MHMAPRAAAWVAWAVWTCNTPQKVFGQKRAGFGPLFFLSLEFVRGLAMVGVDSVHGVYLIGHDDEIDEIVGFGTCGPQRNDNLKAVWSGRGTK
jgi:hypothetical protein